MKRLLIFITLIFLCNEMHHGFAQDESNKWVSAINGLNLRKTPGLKAKKIGLLPYGTKVDIDQCQDEAVTINNVKGFWCRIIAKNKTGWVFDAYLDIAKRTDGSFSKKKYAKKISYYQQTYKSIEELFAEQKNVKTRKVNSNKIDSIFKEKKWEKIQKLLVSRKLVGYDGCTEENYLDIHKDGLLFISGLDVAQASWYFDGAIKKYTNKVYKGISKKKIVELFGYPGTMNKNFWVYTFSPEYQSKTDDIDNKLIMYFKNNKLFVLWHTYSSLC
ncbi:MAG: SH3 domain-containing protein [bacterium]|nr:SH3 domain-containing protein [bacterium]